MAAIGPCRAVCIVSQKGAEQDGFIAMHQELVYNDKYHSKGERRKQL